MRGSHFLYALCAMGMAGGMSTAAMADDPRDPTMTPEAIARDRAIIRKLNQDQLAYVRQRDAQYAQGWKDYEDARSGGGRNGASASYAEARRQYEADLARWRRDVAACRAGDHARCAR